MSKIDLLKHTNEITTIECTLCNRVDTVKDAAEQAIDELYKKGWRVKKGCKCPSCAGSVKPKLFCEGVGAYEMKTGC